LLFMPPCGPHLTPLATGFLEQSLLVFSTPGGLTGDDLSRLFFTCTNTSQAATCTYNTLPRISPHNVVNHSSHKEATIHRSSNHTWSSDAQEHTMNTKNPRPTGPTQTVRTYQAACPPGVNRCGNSRPRARTRAPYHLSFHGSPKRLKLLRKELGKI
jgi:hypothetical protein